MTGTYRALCLIVFALFMCVAVVCSLLLLLALADVLAKEGRGYPWWSFPLLLILIGASVWLGRLAQVMRHRLSRPAG
jgi:hypothetical protein